MEVGTGRGPVCGRDGRWAGSALDGGRACRRSAPGPNRGTLNPIWWGQDNPCDAGTRGLCAVRRERRRPRERADRAALRTALDQVLQFMDTQQDLIEEERQGQRDRTAPGGLTGQGCIHAAALTSPGLIGS
jgi:hypothetical protein